MDLIDIQQIEDNKFTIKIRDHTESMSDLDKKTWEVLKNRGITPENIRTKAKTNLREDGKFYHLVTGPDFDSVAPKLICHVWPK